MQKKILKYLHTICVLFVLIFENIDEYIIKRYNNLLKLINDKVNKKYLNTK